MNKIRLGVIFGGKSSEYGVSLHSAGSLLRQIDDAKYTIIMIGITKEGDWYLYEGDIDALEHDHWQQAGCTPCVLTRQGLLVLKENSYTTIELDCVFPVLHGKNGEDGTIQGLLEIMDIPYVGCDHLSSAICMDKEMTHIICEHAGVPCAPYRCIYESDPRSMEEIFEEASHALGLPRLISNQGIEVLLHGQWVKIIGNICMDQLMLDVTELEQVQEGDVVTLIGEDGEERASVDAISRASHTINNETLTRITARVPRIYKK